MGDSRNRLTAEAIFGHGGAVGAALAAVDWDATPLGAPAQWPQSLRTTVSTLLSSRFSMWMAWGPELTFFCNDAYRRDTLGTKYPWALGRPASQVWEEIWPDVGPRIDNVLRTGEATWDEGLLLYLERSGYTEETYHTFSYSPLRDENCAVVGMLCVVSEDTGRVIAERRMATLRDLGSDPTVVRTEDELLAFAARQLDHNRKDLPFTLTYLLDEAGGARLAACSGLPQGHPAAPAEVSGDTDALWPVAEAAAGRGVVVDLDPARFGQLPAGARSEPPIQAKVTPLIAEGGVPAGFLVAGLNRFRPLDAEYRGFIRLVAVHIAGGLASARSYAASRQRAEQLAELDRAKTVFFSNISHEFRTPLTLILGPLDELRTQSEHFDRRTVEELDVVYRNALRLAKLVNTLLDFSRIEAGRMQAHYEPVDLAAFTAELAGVFRSAAERAGLDLIVDCPGPATPAYVDRDLWEKVVFNLLSNAVKFTAAGSITVAVHRDADAVVVTVGDTGVGISESELPRLFERFHRVQTTAARSTEGSGIGLALVKELVALHGGTISVVSAPGIGTTFTIRVPLGADHLPAGAVIDPAVAAPALNAGSGTAEAYLQEALRWTATPVAAERSEPAAIRPAGSAEAEDAFSVLVADDNVDMREYLERLLTAAGYRVTTVADGRQALDTVRNEPPDLMISDVMMPHVDGLALVSALRADKRTALVPVVLLSARAGQEASIEGLYAGADDYLVKPFSSAELLARVKTTIALARMRDRHARWRSALVHSMQEAFFICEEDGTCIEVNDAFADIVGYGPEGLPYTPPFPWWPDPVTQAEEYSRSTHAFAEALRQQPFDAPFVFNHRNGHQVWVDISLDHAEDPVTGKFMMVGTFRDVTAEHYREQRQAALAELNALLAQAETIPETIGAVTRHLQRLFGAVTVLAATFPADDPSLEPDLVAAGEPARWPDLAPATRERIRALATAPEALVVDTGAADSAAIALQHPHGVLVLFVELGTRKPLSTEEQTLLTVLAGQLGQGLQRLGRIDEQRQTALALQHAILGPADLPVGFAARYQPATQPLEVGGDWYDVFALDESRIAMVVGDCVGHGLSAATVMGQLRSACRALLLQQLSPSETLSGLDRFAADLPGAACTTACCAVLDTTTGELTYAAAGHPPPILIHGDGTRSLLEEGRSIPLGLRVDQVRPAGRTQVPDDATLLLYTDGLVERPATSVDDGIGRAAAVVEDHRADRINDLADRLMEAMTPAGGYRDDVAILIYRRTRPLELRFPARPAELAPARAALRGWLATAGAPEQLSWDALLAVGEAVANAVEHSHVEPAESQIILRAAAVGASLRLSVTDTGRWKEPDPDPDGRRGRGTALMHALMNRVAVEQAPEGTTVRMAVNLP